MSAIDNSSKKDNYNRNNRLDLIRNSHEDTKEDKIRAYRIGDYLEVIYELIQHEGYAGIADISKRLSVILPSLTKIVNKLDEHHQIIYENSEDFGSRRQE